jgi:hypothetical protein
MQDGYGHLNGGVSAAEARRRHATHRAKFAPVSPRSA